MVNKKISDRAIRYSSGDQVEATQRLNNFLEDLNVKFKSVDEIANLGFHQKLLKVF